MPRLVIFVKGAEDLRKKVRFRKKSLVIGRSRDCDLAIAHRTLSRNHCRIVWRDEAWYLEDLGSANGTQLAGQVITDPVILEEGARISAGRVRMVVDRVAEGPKGATPVAATAEDSHDESGDSGISYGDLNYDVDDLADADRFATVDDQDLFDEEALEIDPAGGSVEIQFGTALRRRIRQETESTADEPDAEALNRYDDLFGDLGFDDD
jgi:pSer/pThr/pTyr-binding forkhead associated (FHA) protein